MPFLQETHTSQRDEVGERQGTIMSKNAEKKPASAANTKADKKKQDSKKAANKVSRYFKELRGETKKVVWPGKKQIINNTLVVLAAVVLVAVFIGGLDILLSLLVKLILKTA